jgi:hypothetical protein
MITSAEAAKQKAQTQKPLSKGKPTKWLHTMTMWCGNKIRWPLHGLRLVN